jgi:hypothetical protein
VLHAVVFAGCVVSAAGLVVSESGAAEPGERPEAVSEALAGQAVPVERVGELEVELQGLEVLEPAAG